MLNTNEIELMGLAEAATRGPWTFTPMGETTDPEIGAANGSRVAALVAADMTKQNAAFIAAANPATIIALLQELDGARFAAAQHLNTVECQAKCLAGHECVGAAQAQQSVPAGMVLAPHYRGYANLGTGQYLMNHSAAGNPAEFVISVATEAEKAGRVVGDEMPNAPGNTIQPEVMAVRIGFANVAGLDAMEARLRHLRAEHFAATPAQPIADMSAPTDDMPTMRGSFRTEHSGSDGYWMKFKFRDLDELQQASREWQAARAAAPVSGPTELTELKKFQIVAGCCVDDMERLHSEFGFPEAQPIDADDMIEAIRELQAAANAYSAAPVSERIKVDLELPDGDKRELKVMWQEMRDGKLCLCVRIVEAAPVSGPSDAMADLMPKRAAFIKWCENRGLDTSVEKDAWGAHIFKYPHIQSIWTGWFNAPSAAPVSGQGASIGDWPDFWDDVNSMLIDHLDYDARQIEFKNLVRTVDRFIDSRPRSEDSRAAFAAEAAMVASAWGAPVSAIAAIRALASTTPPKADNE